MAVPDRTLVLSFPSLDTWISSSTHFEAVRSAARQSRRSLLIVIRTPSDAPSLWRTTTSDAAAPSSTAPPPRAGPTPTQLFLPLEQALARIYAVATSVFLAGEDGLLKNVDVVVEQMREVAPMCIRDADCSAVERWQWAAEGEAGSGGKGKGKVGASAPIALDAAAEDASLPPLYPVVALGGTFDHLHAGHKILLTMACAICSSRLVVGVSDDHLLVNKKFKHLLEPIDDRIHAVERFVALVRPSVKCDAVPLQDVYGPTAHDPTIEALVVSEETRAGGDSINTLRRERTLGTLTVFTISLVAHDGAEEVEVETAAKMGSTGIREWLDRRARVGAPGATVGARTEEKP